MRNSPELSLIAKVASSVLKAASGGRAEIIRNPDFDEEMARVEKEPRSVMDKFYDSTASIIIDDKKKRIISKYKIQKKQ